MEVVGLVVELGVSAIRGGRAESPGELASVSGGVGGEVCVLLVGMGDGDCFCTFFGSVPVDACAIYREESDGVSNFQGEVMPLWMISLLMVACSFLDVVRCSLCFE